MKTQIHHAALNTTEFDWYMKFFQNVFGMTVQKITGEKPDRKVWFHEGIQLNECEITPVCGRVCDHLALAVEDIPRTVEKALNSGCTALSNGIQWFELPNGVSIELKELR